MAQPTTPSTPSFRSGGTPGIELEILSPLANFPNFIISGNTLDPKMPEIAMQARITGKTPDPTPDTIFTWRVTLSFVANEYNCGIARYNTRHPDIIRSYPCGDFTLVFTAIRGGNLTIEVNAVVDSLPLTVKTTGLRIIGQNPHRNILSAEIPNNILKRIAQQESVLKQFVADADGGKGPCPLFTRDGGVGLFQITNPEATPETPDQIWSWKANLSGAIKLYNEKSALARGYRGKVMASSGYQTLVSRYNARRLAAKQEPIAITLANYSSEQLERDTIRGFNGYGGKGQFGLWMHEYRVPIDAAGNLIVTLDTAGALTGTVQWEQVPVADRPRSGDPNYVNKVMNQPLF